MASELFDIIGIACLTNLAIVSEPAIAIRDALRISPLRWYGRLLECGLCLSFWTGLAYGLCTHGIGADALIIAGITSVSGELINRKLMS